jgi:DNA ligase (NAD+)
MVKITKVFIEQLRKNPLAILKTLTEDDIATIIQNANHSYYNTKTPLFSDNLYDIIQKYLENKNPNHPILKNVGSVAEGEKKEILPYFMGSLDKIKTDEKSIEKFKKDYPGEYVVSDKLDGNSAMIFSKGGDMKLFTRGDGTIGQNISHLLPFIKNIGIIDTKTEVTLRGELIISKADFETVKDKGANARNMVAGLLNAKVPDLELIKYVQFIAYELITPPLNPDGQFEFMKNLGFKHVSYQVVNEKKINIDKLSTILLHRRSISEFEIDGIVIFHNTLHKRLKENPKYAFAFKSILTMQQAEVIVSNVEWNMSKDGYLIPVVNFNPISLGGVTIKRAHGFNGKFIQDNKIGPGSKIDIIRSGDVIPYIQEILTESETGKGQMPDVKYVWTKTGVDILMSKEEQKDSDELKFKNIEYFFDKIDIKALSSGNIKKIYESGKKTVKDIFNISIEDLLKVEGFKIKMAEKISAAINERKLTLDCITVMNASNTLGRGFGNKKIELIITHIPSILQSRYIPSQAELLSIKGIEKTSANTFIENLPSYFEFIDKNDIKCLFTGTVNDEPYSPTKITTPSPVKVKCPEGCVPSSIISTSSSELIKEISVPKKIITLKKTKIDIIEKPKQFKNMIFVFTGFRNNPLEKYISINGGTVTTSVSKNTTAIISKDSTDKISGKVKKAHDIGVKVINVDDFISQNNINI